MTFQLSPEVDKNKIFLINRSELEERFDLAFYRPKKMFFFKRLLHNTSNIKLKEIIKNGSYGVLPPGDCYDYKYPVSFVRATELKPDLKVDFDKAHRIEEKYLRHKRARIRDKDILIAVKGATIASKKSIAYIENAPKKSILNGSIFRFQVKDGIESKFIAYMLDLDSTKQQMKYNLVSNNAVDYLDKSLLNKLLIFCPSMQEQIQIVAKMDVAYASKKRNEAEAQRLLDSIDDYLLGELGIEMPEQAENTLQSRIFTRQLSEISGGRFDPFFHSLNKQDKLGKYKFYKLNEIANIKKGDSITSNDIVDGDIPVVAGGQTSPYSHNIANSDGNVITVSASGAYSGYVWYHDSPIYASDCTIVSAKHLDNLNNKYLFEYLKSGQQDIYNLQQGSGQPHMYPSDLKRIKIPLPPLAKQTEIANHITTIRTQAKQLQQQAKAGLVQAKKEVEAMILGEDASQKQQPNGLQSL